MRTARLDFNPLARPAPITLGWVPRPNVTQPDKAAPARATPKLSGGGNGRASTIETDWPVVVRRILERSGFSNARLARLCGRVPTSTTKWLQRQAVPGPGPAAVLTELWALYVGGPLP